MEALGMRSLKMFGEATDAFPSVEPRQMPCAAKPIWYFFNLDWS
jgi:hypothetical protein